MFELLFFVVYNQKVYIQLHITNTYSYVLSSENTKQTKTKQEEKTQNGELIKMKKKLLLIDPAGNKLYKEDGALAVRNKKGQLVNTKDTMKFLHRSFVKNYLETGIGGMRQKVILHMRKPEDERPKRKRKGLYTE